MEKKREEEKREEEEEEEKGSSSQDQKGMELGFLYGFYDFGMDLWNFKALYG